MCNDERTFCHCRLCQENVHIGWYPQILAFKGRQTHKTPCDKRKICSRHLPADTAPRPLNLDTVSSLLLGGLTNNVVTGIIHNDLKLKCLKKNHAQQLMDINRLSSLQRSQLLLGRFSEHEVGLIFFTDEKLFTVPPPMNSQNDRV